MTGQMIERTQSSSAEGRYSQPGNGHLPATRKGHLRFGERAWAPSISVLGVTPSKALTSSLGLGHPVVLLRLGEGTFSGVTQTKRDSP